jgi:hypothetical protein
LFNSVGSNIFNGACYGNGLHGVDCSASVGNIVCQNVLCEANGGKGFNDGAVRGLVQLINCGGYNNTSGNYNSSQITDVQNFAAATGSFFTNAATGDFSLNNTASQGALARATGVPGVFPRGTTTGYHDMGAVQHQDAGVGGGSTFVGITSIRNRFRQSVVVRNRPFPVQRQFPVIVNRTRMVQVRQVTRRAFPFPLAGAGSTVTVPIVSTRTRVRVAPAVVRSRITLLAIRGNTVILPAPPRRVFASVKYPHRVRVVGVFPAPAIQTVMVASRRMVR